MIQRLLLSSLRASIADGLFAALWETGAWRLMVFLLIYSTGLAVIFPITPTLMTNGFASLAAGHYIDCTVFTPATSPRECVDAHSTAVTWMSWTNFVSSSLLTFLCAPYVGHLSDRFGRKPFMLAGISLMFLPLAVIQLHLHGVLPIYWYYPASAAGGLVSSFTMTLTSVADLLEQRHRATAVGYLTSCFSLGMLVGPVLGGYLTVSAALWTCLATTGVTLLYVAAFVPECAPAVLAARRAAAAAAAGSADAVGSGLAGQGKGAAGCLAPAGAEAAGGAAACGEGDPAWQRGGEDECAAAAALSVAEDVSLVSAQQHLVSGAVPPQAAAAAVEGAVLPVLGECIEHHHRHHAPACGTHHNPHAKGPDCEAGHARSTPPGPGGSCGNCPPDAGRAVDADVGKGEGEGCGLAKAGAGAGLASGWAVIRGSSFYRRIAVIWVVVSMTWEGAGELLMQYLQLKLGYNTQDQAKVLVVLASGGLVVKLGLLALLVRALGERRLLAFGLLAYAAECVALAAAPSKPAGLAAVSIGSLASVCWPALVALQTAGVDPRQQGAVFGALQAISSMASGLGPLLFAAVFRAVTRSDSRLPSMPGVVWYMAAAMTAVAIGVTLTLPQPAGLSSGSLGADGDGVGSGGRDAGSKAPAGADVEAGGEGRGVEDQLREPLLRNKGEMEGTLM